MTNIKYNISFDRISRGANVNGASLKGYLRASYRDIKEVLGEPNLEGVDDKIRAEWIIKFKNGIVATVYDWKRYEPLESLKEWNIGGHTEDALLYLSYLFGSNGAVSSARREWL